MIGLARASLRRRITTFAATFLSLLLGATLIGSFATLFETSFGEIPATDAETLRIVGMVIGGWGTLIVLFSVASTLAVSVGQRAEEIGLLRVVGASPRQVRRLIRLEVATVAVVAAGLGAALAWPAGRVLFELLRGGGMVDDAVSFGGTVLAPALTALTIVLTALIAAAITARRATSGSPVLAVHEARSGAGRMRWWRIAIGLALVGYGLVMALITITVTGHSDDPYAAMATSGSSSTLVGIGLATLSPVVLRLGAGLLGRFVSGTAPGWLALQSCTRRPGLVSGVLAPVIVLTSAAAGILMLVGIDHRTVGQSLPETTEINLLNNLVTGMICLFAAVMVVNAYAAVGAGRRPELERLRLLGATPAQLRATVRGEALLTAAVGTAVGLAASLVTTIPFSVARHEGLVPDGQLWLPPVVMLGAAGLTLVAALRTVPHHGSAVVAG
jgi:putative ABC transport system permease protein